MPRPWLRLLDPETHDLKNLAAQSQADSLRFAQALNARSRYAEAIEILDRLIANNRCNAELWFERILAIGDQAAEDLMTLQKDLEALILEYPENAAHIRNLGYVKLLRNQEEAAQIELKRALEIDGQDPRTLELMALLCLRREQPAEARSQLLKALTLDPSDSRTLRMLGLVCELMDDPKGAEIHYVAAITQNPGFFWGWHTLGELLIKQGELVDGLRCIHRARALTPQEPNGYFIMAELFSEQGHLEMALAEMHRLVLLGPSNTMLAEAFCLIGEIRKDMGDTETATSYFTLATETNPNDPRPWANMGDDAREQRNWEDARRCYEQALQRDPNAADLHVQLGYVLMRTDRHLESEQAFLAASKADPSEYSAYLGLAECYRNLQRYEEQQNMVMEAMRLAPEDPDVWNAYGVALEVHHHLAEATEAYEKVLTLAPHHRKAANNLGFILEKRMAEGENHLKERAIEAWKQRLLNCRDEGRSMKMATEHLEKLGVPDSTVQNWLEKEPGNRI